MNVCHLSHPTGGSLRRQAEQTETPYLTMNDLETQRAAAAEAALWVAGASPVCISRVPTRACLDPHPICRLSALALHSPSLLHLSVCLSVCLPLL